MNQAKKASTTDGSDFLKRCFDSEQKILHMSMEHSRQSISHDGIMGAVNEQHIIEYLRKYLPNRYQIDSGIVIDSEGQTSDQMDAIIFDRQYTPTLLDQKSHRYIPAESVYAIIEVKPTINKAYLDYTSDKIDSVRCLLRTSVPITHAGGVYPAKPHFEICSAIIAIDAEWKDGLSSKAFESNIMQYVGNKRIDCGIALADRSFEIEAGELSVSNLENSLIIFVFNLLYKLQGLGTVPAIDWKKYASVFSQTILPTTAST